MNPEAGGLTVHIGDTETVITMTGGGRWTMPIGPLTLVENDLERADRPDPAQLTNALGSAHDHFSDVILESPIVASTPSIEFSGPHALQVAYVELGVRDLPPDYELSRADLDEVFRTIVTEPIADRLANPGLDPDHVESIIGSCCVILAIIRRLDFKTMGIRPADAPPLDARTSGSEIDDTPDVPPHGDD